MWPPVLSAYRTHCTHTSSVRILPLVLFSFESFLDFPLSSGRTIECFPQNSERGSPFQSPLEFFSLLLQLMDILSNLHKMFLHGLGLHLNIKNSLKMLSVSNRVISLLYFFLVKSHLFLNILQMIFPVLQI